MHQLCWVVTILYLTLFTGPSFCKTLTWPDGLSFVGLTQGIWHLYIMVPESRTPQVVSDVLEPRMPTYHPRMSRVAYIGADGSLREIELKNASERVLLPPDPERAFTQPIYDATGERLFIVVLRNRKSRETDIVALEDGRETPVVTQRSAQFEPYLHAPHTLYYTNVLCADGCGRVIQEIWRKNLVSEQAEQLTLMNAMVQQPVVSPDSKWLVFSSNKAGYFHIWRMELATGRYEHLTTGVVTDTSPAFDREGHLYFIRHSPDGAHLMRMVEGNIHPLPLPDGVEDLRDLEIHQ